MSSIIYRLPFRALLDNLPTAHELEYVDGTEIVCDPIDSNYIEFVRETADRDSYYIDSMVEFQDRLYFSECWWTTTPVYEDGTKITQELFSWIDLDGNCKWRPTTASFAEQNGRNAELSGQKSF